MADLSEKMALNMTPEEVAKTVEELKTDHSPARISDIARSLEEQGQQQGFVMVLVTFVLLTALWLAIFYALAGTLS